MSIFSTIKLFPKQFWLINSIQTVERLAYWIVLLQMPVYIAQKDLVGGLHWEQSIKGLIFFWWALIQNLSPAILGGFADKFGRKKVMYFASILIIIGFILLGNFRTFEPFLFSTLLLGFGMGIFKPALQGVVSQNINDCNSDINKSISNSNENTNSNNINNKKITKIQNNSALGWGIYTVFVNIAYFLGPSCSFFLKNIDWNWIFWGSAITHSINLILLFFVKEKSIENANKKTFKSIINESKTILSSTVKNIFRSEVIIFLLLITGFTINHMQFYETLPNFVVDWSDTSNLAKYLPLFMQKETARGTMISFEWIYNINSTMLVLFVAFSSWFTRNRNLLRMCSLGLLLVAGGLFIAGRTMDGTFLIFGVFILAIGEILITPRISEYFSSIAPPESRSQYLGYANLAWTLGLSGGGILGGFLYQNMGEKSSFAIKYLAENFQITDATHSNAMILICQKTNLSEIAATQLLWDTYHPYYFWFPFFTVGILASIGLLFYSKKKNNYKNQIN